jgi:hypothetical protein
VITIFSLLAVQFALIMGAVAGLALGRLRWHEYHGVAAVGALVGCLANVIDHSTLWASVNAAGVAINVWFWWKGGGGDDTKRRLRRAARAFSPVRRTAPAAS